MTFLAPNQAFAYGQWRCLAYILWRCPLYKSFSVAFLALNVILFVLWLQIMIVAENKRTVNDFAQLGTILTLLLQLVLFIYGPRCLNNNFELQQDLHLVVWLLLLVVMSVGLVNNPELNKYFTQ